MALAWKAGWVNSPRGFESRILRKETAPLVGAFSVWSSCHGFAEGARQRGRFGASRRALRGPRQSVSPPVIADHVVRTAFRIPSMTACAAAGRVRDPDLRQATASGIPMRVCTVTR